MKRRNFISTGILSALAGSVATPALLSSCSPDDSKNTGKAKNIIFLVSDGMSSVTLNMADLLLRRKNGNGSTWLNLYRQNKVQRALLKTLNCIITC